MMTTSFDPRPGDRVLNGGEVVTVTMVPHCPEYRGQVMVQGHSGRRMVPLLACLPLPNTVVPLHKDLPQ